MRHLIIYLLLLLPVLAKGQVLNDEISKLHQALNNAANDTIRMDIFMNLALQFNEINRDSALYYLAAGLPIAQKLKLKLVEAHLRENQGYMYTGIDNYPKALESFLQALKIAEDPASEKNVWNLAEGQTPRIERIKTLAYLHLTMGHLFGSTGSTDKQKANYLMSQNLAESIGEKELVLTTTWNLGRTYFNLNELDSALIYAQSALKLRSQFGNTVGKYDGNLFDLIGNIYQKQGDYDRAMVAYQKALNVAQPQFNLTGTGYSNISLSSLYLVINKPDSCLLFANKALNIFNEAGLPTGIATAYSIISAAYSEQKRSDSAFIYLKLATTLNDSLYQIERKNLLAYQNLSFDEQTRLQKLEEEKIQMQAKIRTNTLAGGLFTLLVIAFFLYRNNRQKQKANLLIAMQKEKVERTLTDLKSTQTQLIQSEKMASLGELTAGIAHEIQNPLNFVNNFSEVSNELMDEMNEEIDKGDLEEAKFIAQDIKQNLEKINHHGKRADAIVKGMLQHSRSSKAEKEPTDINKLADEYLRLAYHGLRAKDKSFNATLTTDFDENIGNVNVVPQDIGRVILNLITNAFYAVTEKTKQGLDGYQPEVTVKTQKVQNNLEIIVIDNGNGIPKAIKEKIFQPFFTTKPTGSGTGLGLSLSYDIVKVHGGELQVETKERKGTTFIIILPM